MSKLPKWTEERTEALLDEVVEGQEVSLQHVQELAEQLETTPKSVAAKLRKEGYAVELASAAYKPRFSEAQEDELRELVTGHAHEYTYAEIAERLSGDFSPKAVQGKLLSMELTGLVRRTPPKTHQSTYTDEEVATIEEMWSAGKFIEEIAEAVGREVPSVRGKCLSMLRGMPEGRKLPVQRDKVEKPSTRDPYADLDLASMSVEQIAEAAGKTPRGVKTMLTRRGIDCEDYKGAERARKLAKKAEAA